jgi:hypothetical protein
VLPGILILAAKFADVTESANLARQGQSANLLTLDAFLALSGRDFGVPNFLTPPLPRVETPIIRILKIAGTLAAGARSGLIRIASTAASRAG